ncbi:MAG: hypothetical protein GXO62_07280 [Epsilonproteobacteria bacterium]|nr:hypothetical protein [Campylobacterota bacterium]
MRIYGKVENIEDIVRINCIIRDEMIYVDDKAKLSELKKRSDYLCTLTYSPFWKKKFQNIEEIRKIALKENRVSVKLANIISKYRGFGVEYKPWKSEIELPLEDIPKKVLNEITEAVFSLKLSVEVLEDLRKIFCELREAMVLSEDVETLDKAKRGVDIISTLVYIDSFKEHFDEAIMSAIDKMVNEEKKRSIDLANIIVEVMGWDRMYESVNEESFDNADEYLQELLKEEEKSSTYIPTEAKYKSGAKVMWIVYYHPKRKREYAKRVYIPADSFDVKIEGVGEYKNRFGNKVYGVKISYKKEIAPTQIRVRGRVIHLPRRVVTRSKVIELPKIAQNIKITDQKPASAMDIA